MLKFIFVKIVMDLKTSELL